MSEAANAFAGQGAVVLDIGGDIGALIVDMPEGMDDVEIEIRPAGAVADSGHSQADHSPANDGHSHHGHSHHGHSHHVHVGVVRRPTAAGPVPSAVFSELIEGDYELYLRTDSAAAAGPSVQLRVSIRGGEINYAAWPR